MENIIDGKLLRRALNEAQKKRQIGLFIWPNWHTWDDLFSELPGNYHYKFALEALKNEEEATITITWNGLTLPGIIAVSTKKLASSDEILFELLRICEVGNYTGPISLVPSNETIK